MASRSVFCYETKQRFNTLKAAAKFANLAGSESIIRVTNKPDKTAGGYHWCTDLSIFDGADLSSGHNTIIYCYETKEKFSSVKSSSATIGLNPSSISEVINNPNRTAGGYHWCTDLSVLDNSNITYPISTSPVSIYCYETKERFNSVSDARKNCGIVSSSDISRVTNKPDKTCAGYHWCTDLSVLDNIELIYPVNNLPRTIYCYETGKKFNSIKEAAKFIGLVNIYSDTINNPNRVAGGYHWCTDLSVFDGVDLIYPGQSVSGKEKNILDFIKSIYQDKIIDNSREIISPKELDIFIPEKNLAIEFNGIYWHSEEYKSRNYHTDKTNLCKEKGIQLIHVFEHQWDNKPEIFKSAIANKLGLSTKIYARKCKVVELNNVKNFLDNNHLQGNCGSSIKLGLTYNDELVSVMTFGKPRFNKDHEYELLRFCNKLNTTVIGGASKLLKYFERKYNPKSIISYANLQWSNGKVYKNLGFTELSISEPNYWWTKGGSVLSRYQCQKHKLGVILKDKFNPSLSEKKNMENNGYSRLYDCGNMVFVKNY